MAPIYSKKGCVTCKRRRKKCDEEKPVCRLCVRLGLSCQYESSQADSILGTGAVELGVFSIRPPHEQVRQLPFVRLLPSELSVIARVPASMVQFFIPTTCPAARDPKVLMQMVLTDPTVRNAVVSCFSTILPGRTTRLGDLNRISFGSALQSVRSLINDADVDDVRLTSARIAIQFLGLMDSCGSQNSSDPAVHWIALSMLTRKLAERSKLYQSSLPRNLTILALEAVMCHFSILAPFTADILLLDHVWRRDDIYTLLCRANPDGPERLPMSQVLAGQYDLWRLVFEVTVLNRAPSLDAGSQLTISRIIGEVEHTRQGLGDFFSTSREITPAERSSMVSMYGIHCIALLLMLTALIPRTLEQIQSMNRLADAGLQEFLKLELNSTYLGSMGWALQVLACATSDHDKWEEFNAKVLKLMGQLDPGHGRRLTSVMDRVAATRAEKRNGTDEDSAKTSELTLPGAFFLLQQPEGILYNAREAARKDEYRSPHTLSNTTAGNSVHVLQPQRHYSVDEEPAQAVIRHS